jgi:hypothetical protein
MGFGVNISVKLGFPLNCVGLSPEGLAGFTWGRYGSDLDFGIPLFSFITYRLYL